MPWEIEYFEMEDGRQPAEEFEDELDGSANRDERRIGGKLIAVAEYVAQNGYRTGGGYAEKCHDAPDVWQMKADAGARRGRAFFAFDGNKVVLLNGITKGPRQATPQAAYEQAEEYLREYRRTGKVSPQEADDEQVR